MAVDKPTLEILALARSGATRQALDRFVTIGLNQVADDPAVLSLKGRLLKDQARKAKGDAAARLYLQSAKAYTNAAALRPDSYPLINAATMSLFAGQPDHMSLLAQKVLAMLDAGIGAGETAYWHEATRAEALLLLGRQTEAQAALNQAIVAAPSAWEDRAATLRQFRQIAELQGQPDKWLSAYAPPASIYFKGMIGLASDDSRAAKIARNAVIAADAGFGFGALAAGADILIAEAIVEKSAELHLVLPLFESEFRAQSVAPFGDAWLPRFDRLLELAASVTIVTTDEVLTDEAIQLAALAAKGAAIENAARLEGKATGLELNDDPSPHFDAATDNFIALVRSARLPAEDLDDGQLLVSIVIEGPDAALDQWEEIAGGFYKQNASSFASADMLLAKLRKTVPEARCAMAAIAGTISASDTDTHIAKLVRMAQSAVAGTTVTDRTSALAMRSILPFMRFEPLGELPDTSGAINIYAIVPGR